MEDKAEPLSIEELRRLRKPVSNVNIEHRQRLTRPDAFCVLYNDNQCSDFSGSPCAHPRLDMLRGSSCAY